MNILYIYKHFKKNAKKKAGFKPASYIIKILISFQCLQPDF